MVAPEGWVVSYERGTPVGGLPGGILETDLQMFWRATPGVFRGLKTFTVGCNEDGVSCLR